MKALNGYIDKNSVIVDGNLSSYEGYNVIVTILDSVRDRKKEDAGKKGTREQAAKELAGLWRSHGDTESVEETVRAMRRGRSFDA